VPQVLGGWELAGLATARTGLPVNITMTRPASDVADRFNSNQRPNLVPGQSVYATGQTIDHWFNLTGSPTPQSLREGIRRFSSRAKHSASVLFPRIREAGKRPLTF
jgi:hypothetical protein